MPNIPLPPTTTARHISYFDLEMKISIPDEDEETKTGCLSAFRENVTALLIALENYQPAAVVHPPHSCNDTATPCDNTACYKIKCHLFDS